MTDPCCPPPDDGEALLDRARYLVDAGRAERAAASEAAQNYRRCSNVHHTFEGYQNGQPMIQPLGGKPYPARGRIITNASVVRGTPVQFRGCGTQIDQMSRRRGVVEEPVTPDQVFWFVYGVGGATFVNSAIALGGTSIQINYLNGDGCGGSDNPDQAGVAIGVLDLQTARSISFSLEGLASKIRILNTSFKSFFDVLAYRIDQPDTPAIFDIASYRAFVESPLSGLWYGSGALSARMTLVATTNPSIVPSPNTPLIFLSPEPNVVTFGAPYNNSGFYNGRNSYDFLGGTDACTPVFINTLPDQPVAGQSTVQNPTSAVGLVGTSQFTTSLDLTPGKYIIHFSSQLPADNTMSGTAPTYNASNYMKMSVTGL